MRNFCEPWTKFDLQKDDHDSLPSRQIAAQIFLKALWAKQIRFLLMEWANFNFVAEKKWRNSVFRSLRSKGFRAV